LLIVFALLQVVLDLLDICGAETLSKVLIYYYRLIMCEVIYVDSK